MTEDELETIVREQLILMYEAGANRHGWDSGPLDEIMKAAIQFAHGFL